MITKYRNLAWKRIILGAVVMVAAFAIPFPFRHWFREEANRGAADWVVAAIVVVALAGLFVYLMGCGDLAKARGHSGAIVAVIYVLGFCSAVLVFFTPLIIMLGLDDKNKSHRSHGEGERRRRRR